MPGGGLRCTVDELRASISVIDDGPGIPAAERDRVIERLHTTGGTGMGLAIVVELARAMGGGLQVLDGSSGGARFVVTLPVSVPAAPSSTRGVSDLRYPDVAGGS